MATMTDEQKAEYQKKIDSERRYTERKKRKQAALQQLPGWEFAATHDVPKAVKAGVVFFEDADGVWHARVEKKQESSSSGSEGAGSSAAHAKHAAM